MTLAGFGSLLICLFSDSRFIVLVHYLLTLFNEVIRAKFIDVGMVGARDTKQSRDLFHLDAALNDIVLLYADNVREDLNLTRKYHFASFELVVKRSFHRVYVHFIFVLPLGDFFQSLLFFGLELLP